ncbi:hypothetical protein ACN27G_02505 [Plantactinospora sp. WMMB334]|uniref:hypothetical protein n=1 Tax=Plantactinospora sp. WMMB334 TaxID=3404119 RepID=UPI003B9564DC
MPTKWRRRVRSPLPHPEHQVYLLVHVLLFVVGLLVAQLDGQIWLAIGTSVSATGICGWAIFLWLRITEQSTQGQRRIQGLGLTDAFPARSVPIRPEYERRFVSARQQIDFLGFGLRALREDFGDQMDTWLRRVPIRILLVDPDAPTPGWSYAYQRDVEESNSPGSIATDVVNFLRAMEPVKNRFPERLHIRLYTCLPAINVCRIDDEIFWGPYVLGAQSRNTPTFVVSRTGPLFDVLRSHYEQIWTDSRYSRDGFQRTEQGFRSVVIQQALPDQSDYRGRST